MHRERLKTVCRETTLVCAVEAGTASIGLHAFRLEIDAVYVGGELCDFNTSPWWDEVLQDSGRYKACLLREVQPELVIDVRIAYENFTPPMSEVTSCNAVCSKQELFMEVQRIWSCFCVGLACMEPPATLIAPYYLYVHLCERAWFGLPTSSRAL